MKYKDLFPTYAEARAAFDISFAPRFGITKMDWGFGRWLWLEQFPDPLTNWLRFDAAGILTADGRKRLKRAEKEGKVPW